MFLRPSLITSARCTRLTIAQANKFIHNFSIAARVTSMTPLNYQFNNFVTCTSIKLSPSIRPYSSSSDSSANDAGKRVGELVKTSRIVIFMKGDPDEPRCGFSNAVCRILEMHGILDRARQAGNHDLFSSYNVLADEELRTAAKAFADWPTFPQVYFDGEFVGGCDILLDMHRSGKLTSELERLGIGSALKENSNKESS